MRRIVPFALTFLFGLALGRVTHTRPRAGGKSSIVPTPVGSTVQIAHPDPTASFGRKIHTFRVVWVPSDGSKATGPTGEFTPDAWTVRSVTSEGAVITTILAPDESR